ncbi:MAG: hypothetical protein LRY73_02065 [Bacillus sp. (in: Bacteria)]|nr:hypothetical protein [Bacillus sp. (in: firmicutes)]
MNDAIKREFKQIGDITEDSQQRNARYTQQMLNELAQEFQNLSRQLQMLVQEVARPRGAGVGHGGAGSGGVHEPLRQTGRVRIGNND